MFSSESKLNVDVRISGFFFSNAHVFSVHGYIFSITSTIPRTPSKICLTVV